MSRRKSPSLRRSLASVPCRTAVTTLRSPTFFAANIRLSTSPAKTLSFIFSIVWCSSRISAILLCALAISSPGVVLSVSAAFTRRRFISSTMSMNARPVTASMRRTPEATEDSLTMRNGPTFAVFSTCVPPQSSMDLPPMLTTRTTSPYFSPNSAIAPSFFASATGISFVSTSMPSRISSLTRWLTCISSSAVTAEKCVKSKRRRSGSTREPA